MADYTISARLYETPWGTSWAGDIHDDGKFVLSSYGHASEREALRAVDEVREALQNPRPARGPSDLDEIDAGPDAPSWTAWQQNIEDDHIRDTLSW